VGRFVEAAEEPRIEGDVTVVPVYEERLVVEKRLFLLEEVHLRRVERAREVEVPVELRRQEAVVERLPPRDGNPEISESYLGATTMMDDTFSGTRTVTAMFDNAAEAERAIARLRSAGISDSYIRHTQGSSSGYAGTVDVTEPTYRDQHKGFFDSLADFFFPDEDRYTYAEGLARGSHMVTVTGFDASLYDTVVDILDDEGLGGPRRARERVAVVGLVGLPGLGLPAARATSRARRHGRRHPRACRAPRGAWATPSATRWTGRGAPWAAGAIAWATL
jgi:hypothetical protein